jgi:hypothetical protein
VFQFAFAALLALALLAAAITIPIAQRLDMPWDPATLRQPNELKHRLRAILSSLSARQIPSDDMRPIAHTDVPPLGVNTFFDLEVDEATVRRSMSMIRAAGFQWIRQQFAWYEIERPAKGQYVDSATGRSSWEKYDRIINLAGEYGLRVLVRIDTVPAWARPAGSTFTHPPTDLQDYGDFVRTLVARYRGKAQYYQLWNEPNLTFEWGNQNVSASDFAPLLKAGYLAAKSADPQAIIIAPALAPTIDRGPANRNDTLFLRELYEAGGGDYFDVMSTMAYGLLSGPDDRRVDAFWQVNVSRAQLLRQIMVENGDAAKPIWFSELAWNALPDSFTGLPPYGRVTEEQQARYTVRALERIGDEWPWAGVSFVWFFRRPDDSETGQPFYYFRLVEPDFRTLPVYEAIRQAAPSLRTLSRGWHAPTHWAVTLTGEWLEATPGAMSLLENAGLEPLGGPMLYFDRLKPPLPVCVEPCAVETNTVTTPGLQTKQAGAALSFTFAGTDLSIVARGPGRLYVDTPGVRLPRDRSGRAYIDLGSEMTQIELARGLPDVSHQATLALAEGEITLSAIIVDRHDGFPVTLLGAAAIYAFVWGVAWRVRR